MTPRVSPYSLTGVILLVALVCALWLACLIGVTALIEPGRRGEFGDMFGAVNALFSGLAFAGIIFTILLQREELRLQRLELSQTRVELRGQKEQMELQNRTLSLQSFENTFFQLMRLHNDIVAAIDLRNNKTNQVIAQGRDCFKTFYGYFTERWNSADAEDVHPNEHLRLRKTYEAFYRRAESDIGHYFRSLYNIVKFVDTSDVENKRLYTNLLRAQLSAFEVALLLYNCISPLGSEKFKPLVEKYALLKMVPSRQLISLGHEGYYDYAAYGRAA